MNETIALSGDNLLKAAINGTENFSSAVAQHVFKRYIAMLYRLCVVENNNYDLLLGPGDSGAVMVYFAQLFYKAVHKPVPTALVLPVQRFVDLSNEASGAFDNSALLASVARQLAGLVPARVLFVDDEIWKANSASACADLLVRALPADKLQDRILYTIVAENHGFEWHYDIPPIAIQYYAFSKKIPGKNNAVLRLLSEEQQSVLDEFTKPHLEEAEKDGQTKKMDLLLNGMIKVPSHSSGTAPTFDRVPTEQFLSEHKDFEQFKSELENQLIGLVHDAIEEYKKGQIVFIF